MLVREGDDVVDVRRGLRPEGVGLPPPLALRSEARGVLPEDLDVGARRRGLPTVQTEAAPEGVAGVDEGGGATR